MSAKPYTQQEVDSWRRWLSDGTEREVKNSDTPRLIATIDSLRDECAALRAHADPNNFLGEGHLALANEIRAQREGGGGLYRKEPGG